MTVTTNSESSDDGAGTGVANESSTGPTGETVDGESTGSATIGDSDSSGFTTTSEGSTGDATQSPIARPDGPYLVESQDTLIVDAVQGVLANDEDPEGAPLTVLPRVGLVTSEGGTVDMNSDGSFAYQPPVALPFGTDRFMYQISDDRGALAEAEVRVVVEASGAVLALDSLGHKGTRIAGFGTDDRSSISVSINGDVNGDGYADLLIGAYSASPSGVNDAGEAYLIFGGPSMPSTIDLASADVRLRGVDADDRAGYSVEIAGDVNGDGYSDLLVGAYTADPLPGSATGESYLVFGSPVLPAVIDLDDADVRFPGVYVESHSGAFLGGGGDINGDGYDDIVISANLADADGITNSGECHVVLGGPSMPSTVHLMDADMALQGTGYDERACYWVASAGDVNGDGLADIIAGSRYGNGGSGEAYIVYGSVDLPATRSFNDADVRLLGVGVGDSANSVHSIGDVNGDGYSEVFVGAANADPNGADNAGETYLLYGQPFLYSSIDLSSADVVFHGSNAGDSASRATTGDINGDGYADVIIGAATSYNLGDVGKIYINLGGPDVFSSTFELSSSDLRLNGIGAGDRVGSRCRSGHDVNGDGFDDVLISASLADPGGVENAGETYLVLGDDLRGTVDVLGSDRDDQLQALGGVVGDVLVGGRGNDLLRADGGPDVLRGGQGDDTLSITSNAFFRIDGGLGEDTLELDGSLDLNLQDPGGIRIQGIERIHLYSAGASSVALSERRILNLSKTSNTITVDGDADDTVYLVSGSWLGPIRQGGVDRYQSTSTAAVLRISTDVTVSLPPG